MTLTACEFIRRFLMQVPPKGFYRIRHYGLFANGNRAANLAMARALLGVRQPEPASPETSTPNQPPDQPRVLPRPCPCCGGRMIIIEVFARGSTPRHRPTALLPVIRIDTS